MIGGMQKAAIVGIVLLAVLLRFFQLGNLPPSPYWEEVALGYDAYSIFRTGRDHHGHWFPIVAFESFGDWKPGLYIYSAVPFVATMGLTVTAVRMPSALAGIAIVIGVGLLTKLLLLSKASNQNFDRFERWLPLSVMLVAAVEPWGVLFSRAAWEANLATALILWSLNFQLLSVRRVESRRRLHNISLIVSVVLAALAMYTYHAARLAAPLMLFVTALYVHRYHLKSLLNQKQMHQLRKKLVIAAITFLLLVAPLLLSIQTNEVTNRFATTSIFNDISIIETSNRLREFANNSLLSRILYHRYLFYGLTMLKSFVSNFDLSYLFLSGDVNPRHSTEYFGQLFPLSFPLVLLGLSVAYKRFRKPLILGIVLVLFGLLPSLLVQGAPHAVRTLVVFPLWTVLIGLGLHRFVEFCFLHRKKGGMMLISLFTTVFIGQIVTFWMVYTQVYPVLSASEWQYGYEAMIEAVNQQAAENPNHQIYITREQGRPAMYYWFYSQTDPAIVQTYQQQAPKDQSEFLQFGRFHFIDKTDQVSTDFGVLAASPLFTADMGLEENSDAAVVRDAWGNPLWIVQTYEK